MLLEKHKPKNINAIIGNSKGAYEVLNFVKNWEQMYGHARGMSVSSPRFAVITGPSGCGKSLALELVAKELNAEFVEGSVEDVEKASKEQSLFARNKILAVDIDMPDTGYSNKEYLEALKRLSEKTRWPLIFVTNDIYQDDLWVLRKMFTGMKLIRFFPPFESTLLMFLENMCRSEGIKYEREALRIISKISEGDVRFSIIAIESMPHITGYFANTTCRDGLNNVYTTLDSVFTGQGIPENNNGQNILPLIAENISTVYHGENLAYAFRCLALANWFGTKTKNADSFLKALPAAPKQRRSYNFPKRRHESFPKDIAKELHCSSKKAIVYKPILEKLGIV